MLEVFFLQCLPAYSDSLLNHQCLALPAWTANLDYPAPAFPKGPTSNFLPPCSCFPTPSLTHDACK